MTEKVSPVEILKAQVSTVAAEKCSRISISAFIIVLIVSVCMLSFSFVLSRVQQGISLSSPVHYAGFGGVLQDMAGQTGDLSVKDGTLDVSFNYPRRFESNGWLVVITDDDPSSILDSEVSASYQSLFVLGKNNLVISNPSANISLFGDYRYLGLLSTNEIRKIVDDVSFMTVYTQAILFAAATGSVPSAILTMVLLMAVQYVFFILISAALLTVSHKSAVPNTDFFKQTSFFSSLKIMAVLGLAPSFLLAIISYYNPSMGVSFGWLFFSLITAIRAVILYVKRMKTPSIVYSA